MADGSVQLPLCTCHNIFETFHSMMRQREYTDFTVLVDGHKFEVHRMVLAARSPYFEAMFRNPMKEKASNVVEEKEIGKESFELLLEYFYTGKISKLEDLAAVVIEPAERYGLSDLVEQCVCILLLSQTALKDAVISFICGNVERVMKSAAWLEISRNFDLMTEILRKTLNSGTFSIGGSVIDWEVGTCDGKSAFQTWDGKIIQWSVGLIPGQESRTFFLQLHSGQPSQWLHSEWELRCDKVVARQGECQISPEQWTDSSDFTVVLVTTPSYATPQMNSMTWHFRVKLNCVEPSLEVKPIDQTFIAGAVCDEKFSDATIRVDAHPFKVHKVILSKQSRFLDSLFNTPREEYRLDGMSPIVFKQLLYLMYTSRENLNLDAVLLEILPAAQKLQLREPLIRQCEDHLINRLVSSNALALFIQAEEFGRSRLKSTTLRVICNGIHDIIESDGWKALETRPELLSEIMKNICCLLNGQRGAKQM